MKRYIVKVKKDDVTVEIFCKNKKDAIATAAHELNNGYKVKIGKN